MGNSLSCRSSSPGSYFNDSPCMLACFHSSPATMHSHHSSAVGHRSSFIIHANLMSTRQGHTCLYTCLLFSHPLPFSWFLCHQSSCSHQSAQNLCMLIMSFSAYWESTHESSASSTATITNLCQQSRHYQKPATAVSVLLMLHPSPLGLISFVHVQGLNLWLHQSPLGLKFFRTCAGTQLVAAVHQFIGQFECAHSQYHSLGI